MCKKKPCVSSIKLIPMTNSLLSPPVTADKLIDAANNGEGTKFFQDFNLGALISLGQPQLAYNEGIRILNECRNANLTAFKEIHKGGVYYWLGIAAFYLHDHETAVFFFDAAVSEDLRFVPYNDDAPALLFIRVEGDPKGQAAGPLVKKTQTRIESIIELYNSSSGRIIGMPNLKINNLRESFFRPAISAEHENWRSLATTLISFALEWNDRNEFLDLRVEQGTAEPFFIHLFKGCVLFESLLRANSKYPLKTNHNSLSPVLDEFHKKLGIPEKLIDGDSRLSSVLRDLASADDSICTAIKFTGKIRNSVGHNFSWNVPLSKPEYQKLCTMVAISNLHAIACLYKN
jgi:hypothetical protein